MCTFIFVEDVRYREPNERGQVGLCWTLCSSVLRGQCVSEIAEWCGCVKQLVWKAVAELEL